jgi:hypothetical protein
MSELLPGLVVLTIGGSIAPPLPLLTILFLGSRRPLPNAAALALGYFATCAVIGISGLTLFGGTGSTAFAVGLVISAMVGGLLVVLGVKSLLIATDPEASPPGWMESTSTMSPARAFGVGMALFPLQIKNLAIFVACLNLIARRGEPRSSGQHRGGRVRARDLRHPGSRVHRSLCGRAATGLERARLLAKVNGEKQPHDHGGALLRVRRVLPHRRHLGAVRPWRTIAHRAGCPGARRRLLPPTR